MWNDDDRTASFRSYNVNLKDTCDYVPVWKVIKEMYDEDKQALYCYTSTPSSSNYDSDNEHCYYEDYTDYASQSDSYIYSSNESDDNEETCDSQSDAGSTSNDSIDELANKFIYI